MGTTPSLKSKWQWETSAIAKLYVRKISLDTAIASSNASINYRNQRMQSNG